MSNKGKYAGNGALIGAAFGLLYNLAKQYSKSEEDRENFKFDFKDLLKDSLIGAGTGAAAGLALGAIKDGDAEELLKQGANAYLFSVLSNYEVQDNPDLIDRKITKLIKFLEIELKGKLASSPSIAGSSVHGTAISTSDTDIRLNFVQNAGTLEEIDILVYTLLDEAFEDKDLVDIRKQEHSIGLFFENEGIDFRVDIVPARNIGNKDADLSIYVRSKGSRIKTNPNIHEEHFTFPKKVKDVIKLLKGFKKNSKIAINSTYMQCLIKRAYEEDPIAYNKSLKSRLLYSLDFIGSNIEYARIVDPANTNNVLSETLSLSQKTNIANLFLKVANEIKKDERMIVKYFPSFIIE